MPISGIIGGIVAPSPSPAPSPVPTPGGGTGLVRWGPNWGGIDGDKYDIRAVTAFTKISLVHEREVPVAGRLVFIDTNWNETVAGVSTALAQLGFTYPDTEAGCAGRLTHLMLDGNHSVGCSHSLFSVKGIYNNAAAVDVTGSVLGAPFYRSVATAATANLETVTSFACPLPSPLIVGDLLIAAVARFAGGSNNTPAGWTAINQATAGSQKLLAYFRIVDGTEGASQTFTADTAGAWVIAIHRVRGTHPTTPINASSTGNANVTDPVVPSVTTTAVNCLVMYVVSHVHALAQTHTPPASNTEIMELEDGNAAGKGSLNTGFRIFAAAGATGTVTVDCNELVASEARYLRIAIAPGPLTIA